MQFPSLNKDKKEWGFGVYKNVRGGALAAGDSVVLDVSAPDGNRVTYAAAATLGLFVGVALEAIADGDFGRIQTYGYNAAVKVINSTTDVTVPAGASFKTKAAVAHQVLDVTAPVGGVLNGLYVLEALAPTTVTTAITAKCFIRAL